MTTTTTTESKEMTPCERRGEPDAPLHYLRVDPNIESVIWAKFMAPYADELEPVTHSIKLELKAPLVETIELIPEQHIVLRSTGQQNTQLLLNGSNYAAVIQQYAHHPAHVTVRARTVELAEKAAAEIRSWFPPPDPPATAVSVDFWQSGRQMFTTSRSIEASAWDEVGHHYPGEVGEQLDELMNLELNDPDGRVILWHGPPGTGKTSAIRSLARAWRGQSRFQIVLDPEPVFSQSAKLMQVILDDQDSDSDNWRVLVIEDADDIVRADNARTSQSLSRLLNVGDGIVGQGLKVMVLLTTNEPPARLHPALTRPGRCLANSAFRKFSAAEAASAFPDAELKGTELSLAELMTGRRDVSEVSAYGQYL
jgi:energy-coupling factor transporter ATP-binding protein EcfA2